MLAHVGVIGRHSSRRVAQYRAARACQICRPSLCVGHEQAHALRQEGAHAAARHHCVDEPVLKRELGRLEIIGQGLLDGVLDHAAPRKADERAGLGGDDIAQHRKASSNAAGGWIGDDADVGQLGLRMQTQRRRGLGHLHEAHQALLHARAAACRKDHQRQALFCRALDAAGDALSHHVAHAAHHEAALHDANRHRKAVQPRHAAAHGLVNAAAPAVALQGLAIRGKPQRVGLV